MKNVFVERKQEIISFVAIRSRYLTIVDIWLKAGGYQAYLEFRHLRHYYYLQLDIRSYA